MVSGPIFLWEVNNTTLKQHFLMCFLGGTDKERIERWTNVFLDKLLRTGMLKQAMETLRKHRQNGDCLVLLSASLDIYVNELGSRLGFDEVICTQTEWQRDKLTGNLASNDCKGMEKIRRLSYSIGYFGTGKIIAYADHHTDIPLLCRADKEHIG
jgi:phosphatidylglycerophosphatase C